jgi:capsular polysaccharide transport system permease protein
MTIQNDSFDARRLRSTRERLPRAATLRTIAALVLREMSVTYGRTPGGYIWAVLEPALGLALLVFIFSAGFRTPPLGTNFAIYYASGLLPFFMFMSTSGKVQQSINYSKQLLNYPRVTFMDALIARLVLNVLTQLAVSVLIFTFILTMHETRTVLRLDLLLNAYAMAIALGFGVGVLNCLLISRHAIWGTVWSVISRPLLFISGVIFLHDQIPEPYRGWLAWNPLVHVTGEARRAFYYSYVGEYVDPVYTYGVAAICAAGGLLMLQSYYRDLLER